MQHVVLIVFEAEQSITNAFLMQKHRTYTNWPTGARRNRPENIEKYEKLIKSLEYIPGSFYYNRILLHPYFIITVLEPPKFAFFFCDNSLLLWSFGGSYDAPRSVFRARCDFRGLEGQITSKSTEKRRKH